MKIRMRVRAFWGIVRKTFGIIPKKTFSLVLYTFSDKKKHEFFGYYDLNPFNIEETKMLAMRIGAPLKTPNPNQSIQVGYFNLDQETKSFNIMGETTTWNWQQGCRLRWLPNDKGNQIIFNQLIGDNYGAIIFDTEKEKFSQEIHYPIYDLNKSGDLGLSLNFSRLQRLRPGYGYVNLPDQTIHQNCPREEGIWLVNLKEDQAKLLFSLVEISEVEPQASMHNATHYVNHLSFNPKGDSFLFFHLWLDENGKRHSRLFTAVPNGKRLTLLSKFGRVSHYCWLTDEKILVTQILKKQMRYFLYHAIDGMIGVVGDNALNRDGHPTFIKNGSILITDTYPNKFREQDLIIFDMEKNMLKTIARYHMPLKYKGEVRCDLHPRPSQSGRLVCVDFVKNNKRAMQILEISGITDPSNY